MPSLIQLLCLSLSLASVAYSHASGRERTLGRRQNCLVFPFADFTDLKSTTLPIPGVVFPIGLPALPLVDLVPTPYERLAWNAAFNYRGNSPLEVNKHALFSSVAVLGTHAPTIPPAKISTYTGIGNFSLNTAYLGCNTNPGGSFATIVDCTITITGTVLNDDVPTRHPQKLVPTVVNFKKSDGVIMKLFQFAADLTDLVEVEFTVKTDPAKQFTGQLYVLLDKLAFNAYLDPC